MELPYRTTHPESLKAETSTVKAGMWTGVTGRIGVGTAAGSSTRSESPQASADGLVDGCLAGDELATKQLIDLCQPMLLRWARRLGASPELSADVAQECWLHLLKDDRRVLRRYVPQEGVPFLAWLFVVSGRHSLRWLRVENKLGRCVPIDDAMKLASSDLRDPGEFRLLLLAYGCARELTELEGRVLALKLEGYSHAEIAPRCGITESYSTKILWQARKKLRESVSAGGRGKNSPAAGVHAIGGRESP